MSAEELFFKKGHPVNASISPLIQKMAKTLAIAVIGLVFFVLYKMGSALATYITLVNQMPDEVLIIAFAMAAVMVLKLSAAVQTLHLLSDVKHRTLHNWKRHLALLNISSVINCLSTLSFYGLLEQQK